ncbi:phage fiber-tail adaptor protein [Acetobacter oeni]|uniref:Uncharacterized protein n=1 Tax=Acetobacter oeni TaxID=304077 RepID=A0A511XNZ9_9PROT|nr:hypothetical protein [Acetobacter oeni]MBB3884504.1 hypothetical protein [Acetobacter oeni]NHO20436.1 hypothetical protein [Acetobacter oeni]GBR00579.1 hypothetical protein AA21952_0150 [Acetobacter oeni LMG 21952]GEN64685.1 hypothetical protein AOE01nite_29090 [Acetobacter oeni]
MTILNLPAGFVRSPFRVCGVPAPSNTPDRLCEFLRGVKPVYRHERPHAEEYRLSEKSSADVLDYTFDFTDWLSGTSDTLAAISFTVRHPLSVSYDLTCILQGIYDSTQAVFVLASGPPGLDVSVNVKITTAQGRNYTMRVIAPINTTTDPTDPPDTSAGVLTIGGIPITIGGNTLSP